MTPNELAKAVKDLIEANGARLVQTTILSEDGGSISTHSYDTIQMQQMGDPLPSTHFAPIADGEPMSIKGEAERMVTVTNAKPGYAYRAECPEIGTTLYGVADEDGCARLTEAK